MWVHDASALKWLRTIVLPALSDKRPVRAVTMGLLVGCGDLPIVTMKNFGILFRAYAGSAELWRHNSARHTTSAEGYALAPRSEWVTESESGQRLPRDAWLTLVEISGARKRRGGMAPDSATVDAARPTHRQLPPEQWTTREVPLEKMSISCGIGLPRADCDVLSPLLSKEPVISCGGTPKQHVAFDPWHFLPHSAQALLRPGLLPLGAKELSESPVYGLNKAPSLADRLALQRLTALMRDTCALPGTYRDTDNRLEGLLGPSWRLLDWWASCLLAVAGNPTSAELAETASSVPPTGDSRTPGMLASSLSQIGGFSEIVLHLSPDGVNLPTRLGSPGPLNVALGRVYFGARLMLDDILVRSLGPNNSQSTCCV